MFGSFHSLPLLSSIHDSASRRLSTRRLSIIQGMLLILVVAIALGAGLLYLPLFQRSHVHVPLLDCIFTATSAITLTGLVTVSTADTWSLYGKLVILLLMQLGGLSYVTAAIIVAIRLGLNIRLSERFHLSEAHGRLLRRDVLHVLRYTAMIMFGIEAIGAILVAIHRFHAVGHWGQSIFYGIFYAVSAFCNAGFDLEANLWGFAQPGRGMDIFFLVIIGLLALLGSLGISVMTDVVAAFRTKRLSVQAKLVLVLSASFFILGLLTILLFEARNPATLASMDGPAIRLTSAGFLSICARSAGFSPIDLSSVTPPTLLVLWILMLVGGAPAGTASGVKVTTVGVICLAILTLLRRRNDIEVFHRRISGDTIRLALSLVTIYFFAILLMITAVCVVEITLQGTPPNAGTMTRFLYLVFEVLSAFGNVGLHTGITPTLAMPSRIVLILAMCLGRIGPLAFVYIFAQSKRTSLRRLPVETVMAG